MLTSLDEFYAYKLMDLRDASPRRSIRSVAKAVNLSYSFVAKAVRGETHASRAAWKRIFREWGCCDTDIEELFPTCTHCHQEMIPKEYTARLLRRQPKVHR